MNSGMTLISTDTDINDETVQLRLVTVYRNGLEWLINKGIVPSQEVRNAHYIKWEL